ncbi:MAG: hypothetical protein GY786_12560 [Proteobacteria bacterium]|nr:hypothetical protein [Pseudomonadota bacterium]
MISLFNMLKIPEILQGTDGIRGLVRDDEESGELTPLLYYLKTGYLTPGFFELYTYAFASLLISEKNAKEGDTIVVGWDPRDIGGKFNKAACNGIRKAGLEVAIAGNLPTPAIPLYMLYSEAVGSVVLTASHNPADQNGIKLFLGYTGLKLLPEDDKLLTARIKLYQQMDLCPMGLPGKISDKREDVKRFFVSFCLDPRNSWVKDHKFSDTVLVIDASKGAIANVAREIFSEIDCKELILTNMEGDINAACGVADIEGKKKICRGDVFGDAAQFQEYKTLESMFEKADQIAGIKEGEIKLVALVFDGDGDRCFRLDYDAEGDEIMVSSGDLLGIHQARYLEVDKGDHFVNTVESDLNVAITAEQMGYQAKLTGVGDKWILLRAILDNLKCQVKTGSDFEKRLEVMEKGLPVTGFEISRLTRDNLSLVPAKMNKFSLGLEESGHCITPATFERNGEQFNFFGGSGIKTALNSLVAMQNLSMKGRESICTPYSEGVKKTYYVYYVDSSLLEPSSDFRNQLESYLIELNKKIFSEEYDSQIIEFSEESSMLYCKIIKNGDLVGSVFIRNSGTEDKSALYLRGDLSIIQELEKIGQALHLYLLKNLKDITKIIAQMEQQIMKNLHEAKSLNDIQVNYPGQPLDRVLKEMNLKQGLIEKTGSVWTLTNTGLSLI